MTKTPVRTLLACSLLTTVAAMSQALPEDRQKNISIEADRFEGQLSAGEATYYGRVIFQQGELYITAEKILIRWADGEVTEMYADGSTTERAYMRDLQEVDSDPIEAWGLQISYSLEDAKLVLQGNARFQQGSNQIEGAHIEYLTEEERVFASNQNSANTGGEQRVKLCLSVNQNEASASQTSCETLR